jgi:hypothetical protein
VAARALLAACALLAMVACGPDPQLGLVPVGMTTPSGSSGTPIVDEDAPTRALTLRWLPSPSQGVTRYDLSIGRRPGRYDTVIRIPVGIAQRASDGVYSYTVTIQADIDHFFALRAFDGARTSTFSNEIRVRASSGGSVGGSTAAPASTETTSTATNALPTAFGTGGGGVGGVSASSDGSSDGLGTTTGDVEDGGSESAVAGGAGTSLVSLQLDSPGEYLGSTVPSRLGTSGPITFAMWWRPFLDYAPRRVLLDLQAVDEGEVERVTLALIDGEDVELSVRRPDGELAYRALYELAPADDLWQQLVVVFDPDNGLEPQVYLDLAPCTLLESESNGAPLGIPDTDWLLRLGGTSEPGEAGLLGRLGHAAIWSTAVSRTELDSIFKRGHEIDLRLPVGQYESDASLVHYWRIGEEVAPLGYDLGTSDQPIDLDDPAGGLGADDLVLDGPVSLLDGTTIH